MTAQIQTTPKTVSVLGDSYSSGAIDKAIGAAYSPLSSIGAGSAGDFIVLEGRSWGGMSAADAVNNTGPWLNDLQMGGTFAFCARIGVGVALGSYTFEPGEQDALIAFGAHVESARQWGRSEREKLGL